MKMLVVTNSCSEKTYEQICKLRKKSIVDPQQKFFRLLIEGLSKNNGVEVTALSALPVSASTVKKYIFKKSCEETENSVKYKYLAFLNGKISRYLTLLCSSYFSVKEWCKQYKNDKAWIIVDAMQPFLTIPTRIVAQKMGIKVAAVVTDIPTLCTNMKERKENIIKSFLIKLYQKIADLDLYNYDAYIPLTESINNVVNIKDKPYVIIEGFADKQDIEISEVHENYLMYAGGIYEKYGLKTLIEAFLSLERNDLLLYIFGEGTYVKKLKEISFEHPNIKYMGCVSPKKVVEYEKKALLLINPRPINEEFAKYSFPSKTMEYLLSGSAVASTKLTGIPKEYFKYLYSLEDGSLEAISNNLKKLLNKSKKELYLRGINGHNFVLKEKNNIKQTKKIIELLLSY